MAELPERDAALLLDMLLAARDAQGFVEGLDEEAFPASLVNLDFAVAKMPLTRRAESHYAGNRNS